MKSSLFLKLLGAAFALIVATLLVVDSSLTRYAARNEADSLQERLAAQIRMIPPDLSKLPGPVLQDWASGVAKQAEARVAVMNGQDQVLADSDPAQEGPSGSVTGRVTLRDGPGVLRLSAPLNGVDPAVRELRQRIMTVSLGAAIFALLVAYRVSRSLSTRVSQLKRFAESLLESGSPPEPVADPRDELGALEISLNTMAARFHELVDRLSLESARREAILSSMAEGVLAVDSGLRVTFCNHSFARLVDFKGPVPVGVSLLEVVRDPGLLDVLTRVAGSGESVKQRMQVLPASGRSFEVQAAPLATGSGRGAIAVLHDTTDLERLEQVRKDFVANVSHELRTPLASIAGYAETLLDGALEDPDHNRKFIEVIQSSAIRLSSIAADLLVLSELEAGSNPGEAGLISIGSALEEAFFNVEPEAKMRGVKLIRGRIEDAEARGSRIRLEQALVNLLTNAVKFNRPGGEVRADAGRTADGGVFIRISDTGVGIPFEDLPRIFERFYRVDKARSRQVGGTGLGLSIVKHVIERMDGRITAESQLGKGSVFTVVLPPVEAA